MMRCLPFIHCRWSWLLILVLAAGTWTGCRTSSDPNPPPQANDPINPTNRFVFPGEPNNPAQTNRANPDRPPTQVTPNKLTGRQAAHLQRGEKITVTFSDLPPPAPLPHEQRIRDDGRITLPFGITLVAAGKTIGQLEDEIRAAYVPDIYLRLTPIVKADDRSFSVGGEVKFPNRVPYTDRITVTRAIQAAGDFTDFANRKRIELIRSDGTNVIIDWNKATKNPDLDLEIFPGDQIIVHKRFI